MISHQKSGKGAAAIAAGRADPDRDRPATIAKANGQLLIVCSQARAMHARTPPRLPSEIATTDLPNWP